MFQDRCYDRDIDINNNYYAENMVNDVDMNYNGNNMDMGMNMDMNMNYQDNSCNQPIIEPMQEKCVHVYKHTYRPEYSCCEENVVSNIDNGSCCNFR